MFHVWLYRRGGRVCCQCVPSHDES